MASVSTPPVQRWMFSDTLETFLRRSADEILGALFRASESPVEEGQKLAWAQEVRILREALPAAGVPASARLYFEFTMPRLGSRADVLVLAGPVLFVLEFKVNEEFFTRDAEEQVWDYALDLKNFHSSSASIWLAPVVVATAAEGCEQSIHKDQDHLFRPLRSGSDHLASCLREVLASADGPDIDPVQWEAGRYQPTPTIVEAARALYSGHDVTEIARSDAGAQNLARTAAAVDAIIEDASRRKRKAICFVTGVPGAGKTLVGLDIANRSATLPSQAPEPRVFLSGNGPLVAVLREALARDDVRRQQDAGKKARIGEARRKVKSFIQNVHHFRDDCLADEAPPVEHVVLFDEAQRAWTREMTAAFMERKKGRPGFDHSEPEFLISCLDRHDSWCVVVCLVGGGQEINTGEAGISEWFEALCRHYPQWDVHFSPHFAESEYRAGEALKRVADRPNAHQHPDLHLATSMRSFRAGKLSEFVRLVLELEGSRAKNILGEFARQYPIALTRDVARARRWLRERARGSERYGIVVSSHAERLKPHAIDVRVKTDPVRWFLDGKDDIRSSFYLEDVASEFQVQGLELDWTCLVWDADLRFSGGGWTHHEFKGSRWIRVKKPERQRYLENSYRVLLTRARQGMVVVVPPGDTQDPTRDPAFYEPTFQYLKDLGLPVLDG